MMDRRNFLLATFLTSLTATGLLSAEEEIVFVHSTEGNFRTIYGNAELKKQFLQFLTNVFNLFPEKEFHQLIADVTTTQTTDKAIYLLTQKQLNTISPTLSIFEYELPALWHQKEEMARQTVQLLGEGSTYNGYLEVGSSGRYLDYLEEVVNIEGKRYYIDVKQPGYGIDEMVDRGQITIGADFIPLDDYQTDFTSIAKESLDLVCVYIGFHHIPKHLRMKFITDISDRMKLGAKLILRDHDCFSADQTAMVGLAHDVFNMGTYETWDYNQKELRNFYSLHYIQTLMIGLGFTLHTEVMYQNGDPTKNTLMMFTKVQNV